MERFRADEVVLCGSGTQALQLALRMASRSIGRLEAALPAYTCFDLVSAALGAEVTPIFYDVDPDRLQPDDGSLDACMARQPAAVVVVHQFGLPVHMESVIARAATVGALVVEDAAQGQGGSVGQKPLGSLAPVSVLSFGRGKGWTGGAGGAMLLRGHGIRAWTEYGSALAPPRASPPLMAKLLAQWAMGRPALYGVAASVPGLGLGETHFVPPTVPAAMPPAVADVVAATFAAAEREAEKRRGNAAILRQHLASLEGLWVSPEPQQASIAGYLRLPLRIPGRDAAHALGREARRSGLLPSYPRPLSQLPQILDRKGVELATPGAEVLARELFTAPVHRWVTRATVDELVRVLVSTIATPEAPGMRVTPGNQHDEY